jgi:hypothetical protein
LTIFQLLALHASPGSRPGLGSLRKNIRTMEISEGTDLLNFQSGKERSFAIFHDFPPPDIERAWRAFLSRVACPAHYVCPEFFVERHWVGTRHFAVLALNRGAVVGVLTGQHRRNEVLSGLRSRPQICVDPHDDANAILRSLAQGLLAEAGVKKLVTAFSWNSLPLDEFESYGFRRRKLEGNVVLDLSKGPHALFNELHAGRRKGIRKAIKNGVEVSQADKAEDVETFHQLHLKWHETARKTILSPEIPREVFEQRFRHPENFRFFFARYSGKVIAAIALRFCPGGLVEFSEHNSLDEFLHLKPNDLLQWKCIEWACSEGFRLCSLGGRHTFHKRFGGTVVPVIRYRCDRTWLHQYDLYEAAMERARQRFHKLSRPAQSVFRRILGIEEVVP